MNNMTSQELDNPNLITAVSKQRIAVSAGQPVENVDMVLVMYKNMKIISLWLKIK
jgi:signal recognition particle GTPase